ncbi:hypothetical protein KS41_24210 [Salmonella enterica]|nr:hypothetical protein [Salmonella enterica]
MMKAKIYQFPQGKEKRKFQKAIKRIRQAPARQARNARLKDVADTLFYVVRYTVALTAEMICVIALTILYTLRFLVLPMTVFAMIIFWHNNGGVWDKSMFTCAGLLVGSCINPDTFLEARPFQRLLCIRQSEHSQSDDAS